MVDDLNEWIAFKTKIKSILAAEENMVNTQSNRVSTKKFTPYKVRITANTLNIRNGAGVSHNIVGFIKRSDNDVYTIVDEFNGWGLLRAYSDERNGWIKLSYCKKV